MLKHIYSFLLLLQLPVWAGAHYYEGGSYFVTGLNKDLLAKDNVEADFAVRPPAMWCGVYGTKKVEIKSFKHEVRQAAKLFLDKENAPALAVFFNTKRIKLIEEYPDLKAPRDHLTKAPKKLLLGDSVTETYEVGILTGKGLFIYKDGKFVGSDIKNHKGYLRGLTFYIEYLQDVSDAFYPKMWGCQLPKKVLTIKPKEQHPKGDHINNL